MSLQLHYREAGDPTAPPLILLHGLFGSSANWLGIARRLAADFRLIIPDLRNHGRSAHAMLMDYPVMVEDLLALMDRLGISAAHLCGHSMGGKVAMWLALQHPERLERLVVADIAPVSYSHRFDAIFDGLQGVDLSPEATRQQIDQQLARWVDDAGVRGYLLQNLLRIDGEWQWRLNLSGLQAALPELLSFPEVGGQAFPGEALFLHGSRSDYVREAYRPIILRHFPFARLRMIEGAGHWLYAEQPDKFTALCCSFFSADGGC